MITSTLGLPYINPNPFKGALNPFERTLHSHMPVSQRQSVTPRLRRRLSVLRSSLGAPDQETEYILFGFPKIRVPFLGVLITGIMTYWAKCFENSRPIQRENFKLVFVSGLPFLEP